jgi:hypothetical protein
MKRMSREGEGGEGLTAVYNAMFTKIVSLRDVGCS